MLADAEGATAYERAYLAVLDAIDDVPASRRNTPGVCGVWSLQDLMGHLAYWDQQQAEELHAIADGVPFEGEDGDDINAREVANRVNLGWDEIMTEVISTHDDLSPLLISPGEEHAQYLIHEHWEEHLEQIIAWKKGTNG